MPTGLFPGDPTLFDVVLALFLLIGVPAFILIVLATAAVYIKRDAEEYIAELEELEELEEFEEFEEAELGEPTASDVGDRKGRVETSRDDDR